MGSPSKFPIKSNALFHPSPPCFYALIEGFFSGIPLIRCYGPLYDLHAFKAATPDDLLELREKKKSHGTRSGG